MAVCINSAALDGIDAIIIDIETRITPGLQYFIVGLPDESVKESLVRVEGAITAAGFHMPRQKVVISMAPAGIRKQGALFDLPVALSILAESGQIDPASLDGFISFGELSLNGKLRPVKGALSMALKAKQENYHSIIVPSENAPEAAIVGDLKVYGLKDLNMVISILHDKNNGKPEPRPCATTKQNEICTLDFSEIQGQATMRRAMEISAAGGHNLLMIGPPGSGKTMIAKRLPTILPPLSLSEAMEVTRLYSISGQQIAAVLTTTTPFRAPHHTASDISLVGGGMQAQPGEISLAHNGVLFLDELPEFKRRVLEVLRQPLEERQITVSRANYNNTYPAGFLFIAAMNPCPCGFFGHPFRKCSCTKRTIRSYLNRISGPLLDRIDLHVKVEPVNYSELAAKADGEPSKAIAARVSAAREIQQQRSLRILNAQLTPELTRKYCKLQTEEQEILIKALEKHRLSARSYDRILKVARTIADLAHSPDIGMPHLAEAIGYRSLDTDYFAL
ncbi:MAG: YifB family Mg chelatase-like AAA ATPase [Bacteroidota bacterium]|nr:YifB family Mg chelatase-like AAA ATPase [Bacteroidota bacterium]